MGSEVALQLQNAFANAAVADEAAEVTQNAVSSHTLSIEVSSADEDLLRAVAEGSRDALALLFRKYGRSVFHVAYRILKDESEAADLRQEVFLYIFEHAKLFDAKKATAISWIMQVAYHRAFDRRRYLIHRHHYASEELDGERLASSDGESLVDRIDGRIILEKLRRELSEEQRKTLELHIFEGYSFKEIAERSGQSFGNVQHNYYRAIQRLRANLFSKAK